MPNFILAPIILSPFILTLSYYLYFKNKDSKEVRPLDFWVPIGVTLFILFSPFISLFFLRLFEAASAIFSY